MQEDREGSVVGRGKEEMVPERGDPFDYDEMPPRDLTPEELAELYPAGAERKESADASAVETPVPANDEVTVEGAIAAVEVEAEPGLEGPPLDHGLGAVGEPLPEDMLAEEEVAAPMEVDEIPAAEGKQPRFTTLGRAGAGPFEGMVPGEPSVPAISEGLAADGELVSLLVSDDRLRALWNRVDLLRQRVYQEIDNLMLARQLLNQLERARNQLMASRGNFEEAERALSEVEYRVYHAGRVRAWSATIGVRLLYYEILWVLLIIAGMLFLPQLMEGYIPQAFPSEAAVILSDVKTAISTMMWGGLGGVVAALMGLRLHVAQEQDFDRQWSIWYITNPIMGIVLGAFVFLIVRASLFALLPSSEAQIQSTWLIYALGWLAGFQQNVVYDLVGRLVKILEVEGPVKPNEEG